jgi:hypothetical protein
MKYFIILLLLLPLTTAHLDSGEDIVKDGYLIDFGYSPEKPISDREVILAFNLVNDSTKEVIVPESVWIRFSQGDEIIFAGTFLPEAKHVNFINTFPEAGEYELDVEFDLGDKKVEANFDFEVRKSLQDYIYSGVIFLTMLVFVILIKKKHFI